MNEAVGKADVILVLVNHKQFYTIDLEQLSGKIIVDTRGILRSEAAFGQKRQRLGATSTSTSR
jgi:UDP-N-acetyl-D-mannosaminuronate dehydrogenase